MPNFEKVNSKVVKVPLSGSMSGPVIARRGAMLAYTGDVNFVPHGGALGFGGGGPSFGGIGGRLMQRAAGEHEPMMEAQGQGEVWYGFRGGHVTVVDVEPGYNLQVEADRLLVHDGSLQSSTLFIGQGGVRQAIGGAISGQGLFTTTLQGKGSVAVLSHGGTVAIDVGMNGPVAVDPQSYVAALGNLQIDVTINVGWRDAVGRGSGEAVQLKINGQGTVFVQASERKL
jgi:uncharacterized protein (AIM24 family)